MNKAEDYFKEGGKLSKVFPEYKPRQAQFEFSHAMHNAIEAGATFLGEAETGVGKSLAALSAAISIIEKTGKSVVIVTSSILLQEQYISKDIPTAQKMTGTPLNPLLLMGKANYICPDKALKLVRMMNAGGINGSAKDNEQVKVIEEWLKTTDTGELSELPFDLTQKVREGSTIIDPSECKRKRCPLYKECGYYKKKEEIPTAKILVCNYHYFLTATLSLSMSDPGLLPNDIGGVIFDEVHELPNIIRDITAFCFTSGSYNAMNKRLRDLQNQLQHTNVDIGIGEQLDLASFMSDTYSFFEKLTREFMDQRENNNTTYTIEPNDAALKELTANYYKRLASLIETMEGYLFEDLGIDTELLYGTDYYPDDTREWYIGLLSYYDDLHAVRLALFDVVQYFDVPKEKQKSVVWLQEGKKGELYVELHYKKTHVDDVIKSVMSSDDSKRVPSLQGSTSLGMSATVTTGGNFGHIRGILGISNEYVVEKLAASPFDMSTNMKWYLPNDIKAGNEPGHDVQVLDEMASFIKALNGKTLCLFTSTVKMKEAFNHLSRIFANDDIQFLLQGDLPKRQMVEKMKTESNVVIVATRSFFTGVDIPGDNLKAVLIDKFPFPIAGNPVNEFFSSLHRGFHRHALPETIIALKQAFGRLIRTETDKGVVAVFDNRLSTASYKNTIFRSFPFSLNVTRDRDVAIAHAKE